MTTLTVTDFRKEMGRNIGMVAFGKQRLRVSSRGKDTVAIVPIEDLEFLEAIEQQADIALAREALKENREVSWEDLKAEIGL